VTEKEKAGADVASGVRQELADKAAASESSSAAVVKKRLEPIFTKTLVVVLLEFAAALVAFGVLVVSVRSNAHEPLLIFVPIAVAFSFLLLGRATGTMRASIAGCSSLLLVSVGFQCLINPVTSGILWENQYWGPAFLVLLLSTLLALEENNTTEVPSGVWVPNIGDPGSHQAPSGVFREHRTVTRFLAARAIRRAKARDRAAAAREAKAAQVVEPTPATASPKHSRLHRWSRGRLGK